MYKLIAVRTGKVLSEQDIPFTEEQLQAVSGWYREVIKVEYPSDSPTSTIRGMKEGYFNPNPEARECSTA